MKGPFYPSPPQYFYFKTNQARTRTRTDKNQTRSFQSSSLGELKMQHPRRQYLSHDVVHRLGSFRISASKNSEEPDDLDLQEGVADPVDVVLGRVAGHDQVLQNSDEVRHQLLEVRKRVRTSLRHLSDEHDARDQDAMILLG